MSALSYALVTPSFRLDLDRCELLVESVARHAAPGLRHYLVVDRRDLPLFAHLRSSRTELLVVEDIIPRWLVRIPGVRRFWMSFRTPPVRNWILQQMVKLSIPSVVPEDVLLYTDSDTFFIAPYDPAGFERDGRVPLFVETGMRGVLDYNDRWHGAAAKLIGLPVETGYDTSYVGNVICWRSQNARRLQERIAEITGRRWQRAIATQMAFSEYTLYGLYCTALLGEAYSGHWHDGVIRTLNHWKPVPLDVQGLEALKAKRQPQHHSAMISAKSRTAVADIRKVFF